MTLKALDWCDARRAGNGVSETPSAGDRGYGRGAGERKKQGKFGGAPENDSEKGCGLEWKQLVDSPAVVFHEDCIAAVQDSAIEVCEELEKTSADGQLWKHMISGAGKSLRKIIEAFLRRR